MTEQTRILIAYDGSPCADAALDDLRRAGLPSSNVAAHVLSIAEVFLPPPPPSAFEITGAVGAAHTPADLQRWYGKKSPAVAEAARLAERAAERLRQNFPGWTVEAEAGCGSPAWEVITSADRTTPALVVVGSHGRGALGRLVLGSVSQKVLTEARTSVRVARGRVEVEPPAPARIIVGVDGSDGARAAVRAVAARHWPEGSKARVVVVHDPLYASPAGSIIPPVRDYVDESNREEFEWARLLAEEAAEELRAVGLKAEAAVAEGDPKRVLVEHAETWHADAIFLGSTGHGNRLERFLLGSVSASVAARAHCSVEVVRNSRQ